MVALNEGTDFSTGDVPKVVHRGWGNGECYFPRHRRESSNSEAARVGRQMDEGV